MNLPEITSLVQLGKEMSDGADEEPSHGMFIFQKADSYQEIGDWSTLPEIRQREISLDVLLAFDVGKTIGIRFDVDHGSKETTFSRKEQLPRSGPVRPVTSPQISR